MTIADLFRARTIGELFKADFEESKHPRAGDGKFGSGGGGAKKPAAAKPKAKLTHAQKTAVTALAAHDKTCPVCKKLADNGNPKDIWCGDRLKFQRHVRATGVKPKDPPYIERTDAQKQERDRKGTLSAGDTITAENHHKIKEGHIVVHPDRPNEEWQVDGGVNAKGEHELRGLTEGPGGPKGPADIRGMGKTRDLHGWKLKGWDYL